MRRGLIIVSVIVLLFGAQALFAQRVVLPEPLLNQTSGEAVYSSPRSVFLVPELNDTLSFLWTLGSSDQKRYTEYVPIRTVADVGSSDAGIPAGIRNNRYFVESVRLMNLANLAYDDGDFDASTQYSEESVRYSQLSDEFVGLQLKIRETDDAIAAARRRLDYAVSLDASARFPSEYNSAQEAYNEARTLRSGERWDEAIAAADRVLAALAGVDPDETPIVSQIPQPSSPPLPAQYTVRPWVESKDCLWNIAGRAWVYNDPNQWRLLYNANRSRMPQPDNPDLIHPGMVLDIPSIRGEFRQGMWNPDFSYSPLQ